MTERVRVVSADEAAAENITAFLLAFLLGTYAGVAAIGYGLYWLTNYFVPKIIAQDIGIFTYILTPFGILFGLGALMIVLVAAIVVEDIINQLIYSGIAAYFLAPIGDDYGLWGRSEIGENLGYGLVFIVTFVVLRKLTQFPKATKLLRIFCGIGVFIVLLSPAWTLISRTLTAAGWL